MKKRDALNILETEKAEIEKQLEPLRKQYHKLGDEILSLHKKGIRIQEQISKINIKNKNYDWNWLLEEDGSTSDMERYKFGNQELSKIGLMANGYFPETKQRAIRISLIKGDKQSYEKTIKGLTIILPFIKPREDGSKYISILEHTCSEHGRFELSVKDNKYTIQITSYSRTNVIKECDKLEDAISTIQENIWYKSLDKNDKDEDGDYDE